MLAATGCDTRHAPNGDAPTVTGMPGFYEALATLERHDRAAPLAILQIGDSHTANDAFSGRMRDLLQARFGDAGRGALPPGIPFRYYRPAQVSVSAGPDWQPQAAFSGTTGGGAAGPFGVAGLRQRATRGGAEMSVTVATQGGLDRVAIEVMRQAGGGSLDVQAGGNAPATIATDGVGPASQWIDVRVPPGGSTLTLRTRGDGPVDVMSWSVGRATPGVTYANFGTIGATVDLVERWDPATLKLEMDRIHPSLILLAFGTNEGFRPKLDAIEYERTYARVIAILRAAAPDAAIAVIGPPDGNRVVRHGRERPSGCVTEEEAGLQHSAWSPPPHLAEVRAAQRRVAASQNLFYWDWSEAMGGACSMHRWTELDPPLAQPDHVHLRSAGYQRTAEKLFAALMEGYDAYRTRQATR